jgi:methionyl-tRNA synthetase
MIDPIAAADEWGADAIRYLVLREAPFERDSPISSEQFSARFNADLANGLGNLVSRTIKMVESYCEGLVPRSAGEGASEIELHAVANRAVEKHDVAAAKLYFADALAAIFSVVDAANRHYQATQPWILAKDPANAPLVASSLYAGLESLRIVAHALWPYMPNIADSICRQLGLPSPSAALWPDVARWGLLEPGRRVTAGPPLFPRLEPVKA